MKLDVEWIDVGNGWQLPKEQEITKYTTNYSIIGPTNEPEMAIYGKIAVK